MTCTIYICTRRYIRNVKGGQNNMQCVFIIRLMERETNTCPQNAQLDVAGKQLNYTPRQTNTRVQYKNLLIARLWGGERGLPGRGMGEPRASGADGKRHAFIDNYTDKAACN